MERTTDLTARVLVLEEELRTTTRRADDLVDIADGLRDELRELKAAVTIGAAQKKGRR